LLENIFHLYYTGNYSKLLKAIDEFVPYNLNDASKEQLRAAILKTKILHYRNQYRLARDYLREVKGICNDHKDRRLIMHVLANEFYIYYLEDEFQKVVHIPRECDLISDELKAKNIPLWPLLEIDYLTNKDILFRLQGQIDKADRCTEKIIAVRQEVGDIQGLVHSYNNFIQSLTMKGDFSRAESYIDKSYDIIKDNETPYKLAFLHLDAGNIKMEKGELKGAEEEFSLALEFAVQSNNSLYQSEICLSFLMLYLLLGKLEKADQMLRELQKIKRDDNYLFSYTLDFGTALLLQERGGLENLATAKKLLIKLLGNNLDTTTGIQIYYRYGLILINELKLDPNEDIIDELEMIINKLLSQSRGVDSPYMMVKALMLQSELFLIKGDLDSVYETIINAQSLCNKHELFHNKKLIDAQIHKLKEELTNIESIFLKSSQIRAKFKNEELDEFIDKIIWASKNWKTKNQGDPELASGNT